MISPSLMRRIERFSKSPMQRYFGTDHYIHSSHEFAILLKLAGVKKVEMSDWFRCGAPAMENVILNNSITMSPFVEVKECPLPWYLLKKAEIRYCGGASREKGSMQFSVGAEHKDFIREIYIYFNIIKRGKLKTIW